MSRKSLLVASGMSAIAGMTVMLYKFYDISHHTGACVDALEDSCQTPTGTGLWALWVGVGLFVVALVMLIAGTMPGSKRK